MNRYFVIIASLLMCLGLGGNLSAREVININRNWRFFSNSEGSSDRAQSVNIPHTWNSDALSGKKDYFRGVGNYMKDITVPESWRNKRVFIKFNGATTITNVLVNGRHVGENRGGYTPFTFELTGYLKYGENNFIWVIVNNSPQLDIMPTAGDINIYGGLIRDVELIVTEASLFSVDPKHPTQLIQRNITAEKAEVDAMIKIDGLADRNLSINLLLTNAKGDTVDHSSTKIRVPATGKISTTVPIVINKPTLWNGTQNPYLYNVSLSLVDENITCDSLSIPLGVRYFSVDPKLGFMLNGKPYRLKGVYSYEDRAGVGNALTAYQIKEDLDLITEMGANSVRAAAYPHNTLFYQECDRRGIIVWSDLPFIGPAYMTDKGYLDHEPLRENGRIQLSEMIRQLYNHPSIVMWGIFSNLSTRGEDPTNYIKELNSLAFKEDPTRLSVAASNQDGEINFATDLIVWDQVFGWKEGIPTDINVWLNQLKNSWSQLRSGVSYGVGASIYHQSDSLYRPPYLGNWHPERWQTYLHEQYYPIINANQALWGWYIANMFDYGASGRSWGEGNGIDDRGLVTFDRKYRKDAFYFYKANWNPNSPFVYITEKRWDERSGLVQNIKVYSNQPEVELFINGVSFGKKTGINGTFTWEKLTLKAGDNNIEAVSIGEKGTLSDKATIYISAGTVIQGQVGRHRSL